MVRGGKGGGKRGSGEPRRGKERGKGRRDLMKAWRPTHPWQNTGTAGIAT